MAINKNFVIKNELEVDTNLILADPQTNKVGIGTTVPQYTLHVNGGIGVTNAYVSGITTVINELRVGAGGSIFSVIAGPAGVGQSVGVGTARPAFLLDVRAPVSTGQTALYVQGDIRVTGDLNIDDITTNNLNVSGVSTFVGFSTFNDYVFVQDGLNVSGAGATLASLNVSGVSTFVGFSTFNDYVFVQDGLSVAGAGATLASLNVSGVSTFVGFATFGNNIFVAGIGTITTFNSTNGTITNLTGTSGTITTLNSTNGTITNLTGTSGTITTLNSTNGTITNLTGTSGTITTLNSTNGTITNLTGTSGTITTLNSTNGTITNLTGTSGTITTLNSTNGTITNLTGTSGTITTLNSTNGTITNLTGTSGTITTLNATGIAVTNLTVYNNFSVGGVSTFTNGPILVGTATSTGTASQPLQVTGGAYVSGSVGIGTTNPTSKLHVIGDVRVSGVGTITTFNSTNGTITNLTGTNVSYSGISTLGTVNISSGIITATSGVVTYFGDGNFLNLTSNPSRGIGIGTTGGVVGYAVTFINFKGSGVSTAQYNSNTGIATIFFEGGGGGGGGSQTLNDTLGLGNASSLGISVGISTFNNVVVGGATTQLIVVGNARVTGILTVGSSSITLNGISNIVNVGSGITINESGINVTGVVTATSFVGSGANLTGIVTSIIAGTNVTVSGSTGQVTINSLSISTSTSSTPQFITFVSSASTTSIGITASNLTFIPSSGSLGIGTTNPTGKLQVGVASSIFIVTGIGSVGIGTANPGASLHTTPTASSIAGLFSGTTSSDMVRITQLGTGNALVVEDETNPDTSPFVINSSGSIGIGTTNPRTNLDVTSSILISTGIGLTPGFLVKSYIQSSGLISFEDVDNSNSRFSVDRDTSYLFKINNSSFVTKLIVDSSGNLGIGTTNPLGPLQIGTGSSIFIVTGIGSVGIGTTNPLGPLQIGTGSSIFIVTGIGSVGIGTTNPTSKLHVIGNVNISGSLTKGSGTFVIPHPILPDKNLVHSFVESPRADLIYRGVSPMINGISTVIMDEYIGLTTGTWKLLCREPQIFLQNNSDFSLVKGNIDDDGVLTIISNTSSNSNIDWMVVAERQDEIIKKANWTDENGKPILEPYK